jgi:hypothetical protein
MEVRVAEHDEKMNKIIYSPVLVVAVGFILNLLWENVQAPLYLGYSNLWQHFWVCFKGALGDGAILIFLYIFLALLNRNLLWITKITPADILILVGIGTAIAIGVEKWALMTGRWGYTSAMPLLPLIGVGLPPILQMAILPLFTFTISKKII